MVRGRAALAAGVMFLCGTGTAVGQTAAPDDTSKLADEIITCAGLSDSAARLDCFDTVAKPLVGLEVTGDASGGTALQRFIGKDDWDSDVVEITTPWRLVWQNQGSLLTVELRTAQGEMVDVIGNQIGQGGGRSTPIEPGSYRLAVRGLGGWRLQLISDSGN